MELSKYKACICEGAAESAIIDILVDNGLLIFSRSEMIDESVIRCRSAKRFEERYLRKGFDNQISVVRILDSRREEFRLSKAYAHKIDVINVITAPEIEMLIILNEGAYERFKRSGKKPSDFCKIDLRMHDVANFFDITDVFCAHFDDKDLVVGFHHFANGAHNAHRRVETARSHQHVELLAEDAVEIVLCARFAVTSGNADNLHVGHSGKATASVVDICFVDGAFNGLHRSVANQYDEPRNDGHGCNDIACHAQRVVETYAL